MSASDILEIKNEIKILDLNRFIRINDTDAPLICNRVVADAARNYLCLENIRH